MSASVEPSVVSGFDALVVQNDRVRAVIIPSLGGRIWELTDLERNRQWIWHREDVPLAENGPGASYDDVWAGGWEELFPNDASGDFEGRSLSDHGIWWTTAWNVATSDASPDCVVRLTARIDSPACDCEKEIRLGADSNTLSVSYRITSRETDPFHFLFKQHLPVDVTPECTLALPGGCVTPVDPSFSTLSSGPASFDWPLARSSAGADVDLRQVPARSRAEREFVYVSELPQPWCGVVDAENDASIRMQYDGAQFPFVWLFLTYGGWRDCYTAVLEPCTNMPKDLATAARLGQSAVLLPGHTFATEVSVTMSDAKGASE